MRRARLETVHFAAALIGLALGCAPVARITLKNVPGQATSEAFDVVCEEEATCDVAPTVEATGAIFGVIGGSVGAGMPFVLRGSGRVGVRVQAGLQFPYFGIVVSGDAFPSLPAEGRLLLRLSL